MNAITNGQPIPWESLGRPGPEKGSYAFKNCCGADCELYALLHVAREQSHTKDSKGKPGNGLLQSLQRRGHSILATVCFHMLC